MLGASLALFFIWVAPANTATQQWTMRTPPPECMALRARWEKGHAMRAGLAILGLAGLILSALAPTKETSGR